MTQETELAALHGGIRSGQIECPTNPPQCRPRMGIHADDCPRDRAIKRIYEISRALENQYERSTESNP